MSFLVFGNTELSLINFQAKTPNALYIHKDFSSTWIISELVSLTIHHCLWRVCRLPQRKFARYPSSPWPDC